LPIFVVRVIPTKETLVTEWLADLASRRQMQVHSILFVPQTPGFVYVEAVSLHTVDELLREYYREGGKFTRGVLTGVVPVKEIESMLSPTTVTYDSGDRVDIVAGPCRGLTGIVLEDRGDDLLIQLDGAASVMPLKIRKDYCRRIKR